MKILPLYFPRSSQEEVEAIKQLPEDIGSEDGEPIIPERQIRIMDKPMHASMSMQSHWNQINIIVKAIKKIEKYCTKKQKLDNPKMMLVEKQNFTK